MAGPESGTTIAVLFVNDLVPEVSALAVTVKLVLVLFVPSRTTSEMVALPVWFVTAVTVTVTAVTGTADLSPGFVDGDVFFTLTNTNPYPVTFTSMASGAVTSSNTGACPSSNVTVDASATGLSLTVAANATSATLSIPDVVNMLAAAPDGCQGKTFDIVLTLTGSQV